MRSPASRTHLVLCVVAAQSAQHVERLLKHLLVVDAAHDVQHGIHGMQLVRNAPVALVQREECQRLERHAKPVDVTALLQHRNQRPQRARVPAHRRASRGRTAESVGA